MARSKVIDEEEARQLLENGETYDNMVKLYRRKYGVETTPSMWSRVHKRLTGSARQVERASVELVPWIVRANPRGRKYLEALRTIDDLTDAEGVPEVLSLPQERALSLYRIRRELRESGEVIDYDRERNTFRTVPRREGIDKGWIREPYFNDDGSVVPLERYPHRYRMMTSARAGSPRAPHRPRGLTHGGDITAPPPRAQSPRRALPSSPVQRIMCACGCQ
jgi:hypothetical protein